MQKASHNLVKIIQQWLKCGRRVIFPPAGIWTDARDMAGHRPPYKRQLHTVEHTQFYSPSNSFLPHE